MIHVGNDVVTLNVNSDICYVVRYISRILVGFRYRCDEEVKQQQPMRIPIGPKKFQWLPSSLGSIGNCQHLIGRIEAQAA